MAYQVVLVTCPSIEEARVLAKTLVDEDLCACVNVISHVESFYKYEGEYFEESEVLLVIKSTQALFTPLSNRIKKLHTYETPEIIALDIVQGDHAYLEWLGSALNRPLFE